MAWHGFWWRGIRSLPRSGLVSLGFSAWRSEANGMSKVPPPPRAPWLLMGHRFLVKLAEKTPTGAVQWCRNPARERDASSWDVRGSGVVLSWPRSLLPPRENTMTREHGKSFSREGRCDRSLPTGCLVRPALALANKRARKGPENMPSHGAPLPCAPLCPSCVVPFPPPLPGRCLAGR